MRAVTAAAASSMVSPCSLKLHETRELTLRFEEEGCLNWKASHAGIIRIGFEGISQPHFVEHPCFNILIESLPARFCKPAGPSPQPGLLRLLRLSLSALAIWRSDSGLYCEQFRIDSVTRSVNNRDRMRLRNKKHRERLAKFLFGRRIFYCVARIA